MAREKRILVVEDDEPIRALLFTVLRRRGFRVDTATNGREATERLNRCNYSLVLLDLMMPEIDGFEFLTALRHNEAWQSIPVVVLTSKDLSAEERQLLSGNVEKILQKGAYSREALLREVRRAVARYAGRPPDEGGTPAGGRR